MDKLIVGITQFYSSADPHKNAEKLKELIIKNYREADLVVTPEYSMLNILSGIEPEKVYEIVSDLEDNEYLSILSDLASDIGAPILTHILLRSDEKPRCYSQSILVKPSGDYELIYRKIHLFDAYGYRESDYLLPGEDYSKELSIRGFNTYTAICYDIRFPELFRAYAWRGAHVIIVQAGWVRGPLKEEILEYLAISRSHENTVYIVLSNQTGDQFTGRSGVFNPYGYRELDMGFRESYKEYSLDMDIIKEARRSIPVLEHSQKTWNIELKK
ncbi:MAG: nitrilase-related carbon-nitrogen hydrolase [Thermoprotei archaeon]